MLFGTIRRGFAGALAVLVLSAMIASAAAGGQVTGTVSVAGGPVAGARVTLFVPSLAIFLEARTGPDGTYMFQGVASGSYSLGVAAVGYGYVETAVTVTGVR